jgi:hypothetical protein
VLLLALLITLTMTPHTRSKALYQCYQKPMLIQIYIAAGDGPILQKGTYATSCLYERGGMIFAVLEPGNDGEALSMTF